MSAQSVDIAIKTQSRKRQVSRLFLLTARLKAEDKDTVGWQQHLVTQRKPSDEVQCCSQQHVQFTAEDESAVNEQENQDRAHEGS